MSFAPTFATPFFASTGVVGSSAPTETGGVGVALPNSVVLDGYLFGVDLGISRFSAQDTFRDNVVATDQPNDTLFNARGAWGRYDYSWHHGASQSLADLDPTADAFRFDTSVGIRWDERLQATLLHDTMLGQAGTSATPLLIRSADYVFFADGTNLYRTSDLSTWTLLTAPGGTIQGLATDGTDLYVATSTKLVRYLGSNTTSTAFGTPVAGDIRNVAIVGNRCLISAANVLQEVAGSGAVTTIKTHMQATFAWTTMFAIGSRIYVGGYSGSRSELYSLTTDSSGALVQSSEAAPFPTGELLRTGVAYAGLAMLCTSKGLRMADVSGDGTLTYGPLLTDPGDVRCACGDNGFGYFGWSQLDLNRSGVGKLAFTIDVQPLQPAFGTDVSESTTVGAVTGVARLNDRTVFAVANSGAWVESATVYEGQGELTSSKVAFGTVEPKALIGVTATFQPLLAGQAVEVIVKDEYGVVIGQGIEDTVDATTFDIDLGGETVPFCTVTIRLYSAGTDTPTFLRWRLRAYPVPPAVRQWLLGLTMRDVVRINGDRGQEISYSINDVYSWIEDLWATKRYTILRVGNRSYRVRIEQFELRPTEWSADGMLPTGILVVQAVAA